jgi:hypothetical protein
MFQATDTYNTTPSEPPAGSVARPPKYNVTRSQVMKRAWQLAKLNRRTAHDSGRERLGQYMRMAWTRLGAAMLAIGPSFRLRTRRVRLSASSSPFSTTTGAHGRTTLSCSPCVTASASSAPALKAGDSRERVRVSVASD